jgi:hypothetical protein
MIRCRSCRRGITRLLAAEKARAVSRWEETFTFRCPHCSDVHQVSIDSAGELALILEDGGLRTPSFFDVMFADPEIRKMLWADDEEEEPEES